MEKPLSAAKTTDIEAALREGKTLQFPPQGTSMYPMLTPGDEVVLSAAAPAKLRRGDVVLYRRTNGMLVLHRVWQRSAGGFYLLGDNQTAVEGPVAPEQICGLLTGFVRKGKKCSAQNPIYRLYAHGWLFLRPFRRLIAVPLARLRRKNRKK